MTPICGRRVSIQRTRDARRDGERERKEKSERERKRERGASPRGPKSNFVTFRKNELHKVVAAADRLARI